MEQECAREAELDGDSFEGRFVSSSSPGCPTNFSSEDFRGSLG